MLPSRQLAAAAGPRGSSPFAAAILHAATVRSPL
jgi:hypothetical protein